MAIIEFEKGAVIYCEGDPVRHLSLITKGETEATFGGRTFGFEKADVIGLCDLGAGKYGRTYKAVSDVSIFQYLCDDFEALEALIRSNADIAFLMVNSMCRQITDWLQYISKLKSDADSAFDMIQEIYPEYVRLSKTYAYTPKKLPGLAEVTRFPDQDAIKGWIQEYYAEIRDLDPGARKRFFFNNPGITSGFLRISSADAAAVRQSCAAYLDYIKDISKLLLDNEGLDLFSVISELHVSSINIKGADEALDALITPLTWLLSEMIGADQNYFQERLDSYGNDLSVSRSSQNIMDTPVSSGISQNLLDSLDTILSYSGCPEELCNKFSRFIHDYTDLTDRVSSDDAYDLRRGLTTMFYEIYQHVFIKSLSDPATPTVVKMFLNFGYVDPALAGYENADYLYSIADSVRGDPTVGVYTICEWLEAIYKGEKEPSLSEFDMDYQAFVRDLKQTQKLDDKEVARLLANQDRKLRYELENLFPVVNRVTFGNPSKFSPVFSDHNVLRSLEDTLVSPSSITEILNEIREIDFSAFFRETSFSNQKLGVPNEIINVEIMPNIILMPNVGTRGSMWQEIEGRVRTTPARMFMPIFLEKELKQTMIRMTGEFRWEMCKRVQGSRWNDVTDPSLTSLFSDYLQFYQNNRNLSMETMLAIRNELSSARNNYKALFVSNYAVWLLNESKGSARLNSIAITILMTFCPFSEPIREKLANNMRYAEPLNRFRAKHQKRLQHLTRLVQKLRQSGKQVPQELLDELEYAKR